MAKLSSRNQAGNAVTAPPARLAEETEGDQRARTVITERESAGCFTKLPSGGRKGVRLEKRLSLCLIIPPLTLRPEAPEVSTVLKPGLLQ